MPGTTSTQRGSVSSQSVSVLPSSDTVSTRIVRWSLERTRSSAGPLRDQCAVVRYGMTEVSQSTGFSVPSSPATATLTSAFAVPAAG